ncbi:hypothetical protein GF389_05920 [Candidatus Dojkabacteria bacterium]|nr:hypothetical protein [Candidatus Dojkabacteria bacterium]
MTKRKLTEEEIKVYKKQEKRTLKEKEDIETGLKILKFKREVIYPHSYKMQQKEVDRAIKESETLLQQIDFSLKTSEDHLKNGVEIKKNRGGDKCQDSKENAKTQKKS